MANENYDPYDQAYWGKGKRKKGKKGKSKFQYPYDGNKGYPSYENAREKADMTKENLRSRRREAGGASCRSKLLNSKSLPRPVGQTKIGINHGHGTNKAGTHPMEHPAQDKR